ncbi:MAG TPA: helix-turn-helix transcriptional regulator [Gemmatimonadaceae bacterium]|jgi:DNA-binding PadR family transcriptional regulator
MADQLPIVRGTLDILVLKALSWGPMHGPEIIVWLEDRSGGRLSLDDSAVLQAFHRLEERGLLDSAWGTTANNRRARYYRLTAKGRAHLKTESAKVTEYAETLAAILAARNA